MGEIHSIRQKTWGVFIKPYTDFKGDMYVHNGSVSFPSPSSGSYVAALGGEPFMLYKTASSFAELRDIIKEVFDELGQNKIKVCEIIPTDYIVTPLS